MELQKERLDCQARILFYFIFLFTIKTLFPLLTRTRFALFIFFLLRLDLLLLLGICLLLL
jgi:hypothetical protein